MKWRGAAIGGGATSGKLGPAVASRNRGGQYLRSRVVPSGATPTPQQEVIRNAIRSVVPQWTALDASQRAAWNTYGQNVPTVDVLGDTIQLSGQNWFVGANVIASQLGTNFVGDAPTTFDRGTFDLSGATFVAGASVGTLALAAAVASLGDGSGNGRLGIFCSRDYSAGRSKYFGSFQLAASIPGNDSRSNIAFVLPFAHDSSNLMALQVAYLSGDGRYTTPSRLTVTP